MSTARDFVRSALTDALMGPLRLPVVDIIYETIDERQIPTRTDFKELRDRVNALRGQTTGATGGVKRLAETTQAIEERLDALEHGLELLGGQLALLLIGLPLLVHPTSASGGCRHGAP